MKRNSKGGKRADLDGLYLRSAWEANYCRYLNWLVEIGEIASWEYEPDEFEFEGIKRGSRFYTPDFKIVNPDGSIEYHEVKGYMDARSKTKLKRMAKHYPEIKLVFDRQRVLSRNCSAGTGIHASLGEPITCGESRSLRQSWRRKYKRQGYQSRSETTDFIPTGAGW